MTTNVVFLFNKENGADVPPLTKNEVEEFKKILQSSVDTFHTLDAMQKYKLYKSNVELTFTLMKIVDDIYFKQDEQ